MPNVEVFSTDLAGIINLGDGEQGWTRNSIYIEQNSQLFLHLSDNRLLKSLVCLNLFARRNPQSCLLVVDQKYRVVMLSVGKKAHADTAKMDHPA